MLELRINAYDAEEVMIIAKAMEQIAKLRAKAMDEADKFIAQHPEVLPKAPEAVQEPVQAEQEAVQAEQEPAQPEPAPAVAITLVDIRREANKLIKKDKAKMKEIFSSFGAEKLSEIPEEKYPELMDKVVSALA